NFGLCYSQILSAAMRRHSGKPAAFLRTVAVAMAAHLCFQRNSVKRFTATEKWEDPWFRKLTPKVKLLWCYFCDRCDHAGVIDLDLEVASFYIGDQISMQDLDLLGEHIQMISPLKIWLPKFVKFQYGKLS